MDYQQEVSDGGFGEVEGWGWSGWSGDERREGACLEIGAEGKSCASRTALTSAAKQQKFLLGILRGVEGEVLVGAGD
jgi:hypothetical protein